MLTIALPKGRMGERVYRALEEAGDACPELLSDSRRLLFEVPGKDVRYLMSKPADVAVYVQRGAADMGIVGRDVLLEQEPDVYELCDLGFGKCALCVAARNHWRDDTSVPLRVATKYPNVAQRYFGHLNRDIEIIKLNGSIELGPVLGLSDVIVDIVETGSTLRENDLRVVAQIEPSSARVIANRGSYQFYRQQMDELLTLLKEAEE